MVPLFIDLALMTYLCTIVSAASLGIASWFVQILSVVFITPAVKSVRDRPAYFAEKLYKSMKGAGTDEHTLTRIMVTRSEIDMVQIKQRFQEHYGKTLASFIKVLVD